MINAVIRWCLTHAFLVVLGIVAIGTAGYFAVVNTPVDAIPDVGEKQVIVFADWPGRSPQDVDNQVTYPLTTSLTGTPGVKSIRSMSGFGFAMVFVIFKNDVDYYWARSRVLERINVAQQRLPAGVTPVLGPDATALGQVLWYTVEAEGFDLAELRSIQDWYLRYQLNAVEGVSEVASIGGHVKQYQIDVHPDKLRAHRVTLMDVYEAVRNSNIDVGAKVLEKNGVEFFIRGVGFIKSVHDLEKVVIRQEKGTPIQVKHVATVTLGPEFRRGALDKGGVEAVGGVVLMRYGENPRNVVAQVKEKIKQLELGLPQKTLPDGRISKVKIVPFYDRTEIVNQTIDTLREALLEEVLMASAVIFIFLLHLRSTLSVIVTLPLSVGLCFILMYGFGVDANIMSLAGLAIAIGDVGDMGIIMTENIYRHIATGDKAKSHFQRVYDGASEVGGAIVTAVSNTLVSFIPVFFLTGQEGLMFRPLAFTKTFAIGGSVVLALTVVPLVCLFLFRPVTWSKRTVWIIAGALGLASAFATHAIFAWAMSGGHYSGWPMSVVVGVIVALAFVRMTRERFLPLEANPVSRGIARVYTPVLRWILAHKKTFLIAPVAVVFTGMTIWLGIGTVLAPVGWTINLFAREQASPGLKKTMAAKDTDDVTRPLVEFDHVRRLTVKHSDGSTRRRIEWRRPDPKERDAEKARGIEIVQEKKILSGIGREFMPPLDDPGDVQAVRAQCVFTTHTPVPAGHDRFALDHVARVLGRSDLFAMHDVFCCEGELNMTYLALNLSHYVNGVAKKHGEVSRRMLTPRDASHHYQIDHITNGVHLGTWAAPSFGELFDRHIPGWRADNVSLRNALRIPLAEIWEAHQFAKKRAIDEINHRANASFDLSTFTLGFARRAATYKRADLLLTEPSQLADIAARGGPLQIVYAGKAHPRDDAGKRVIQRIVQLLDAPGAKVKIVYLDDYDWELGALLTSGVDVWLNTPLPPLEASGTSGMKAALNGVPSLSVLDGWWIEGCIEGVTGWAIDGLAEGVAPANRTPQDAASLYRQLGDIVLPLYYDNRDRFIEVMRHAIALNAAHFNTQRMVQEYIAKAYF